jgi:hypothetical protein
MSEEKLNPRTMKPTTNTAVRISSRWSFSRDQHDGRNRESRILKLPAFIEPQYT